MKSIKIVEVTNGYDVAIDGAYKGNGPRVYKFKDEIQLVKDIYEILLSRKINVEEQ